MTEEVRAILYWRKHHGYITNHKIVIDAGLEDPPNAFGYRVIEIFDDVSDNQRIRMKESCTCEKCVLTGWRRYVCFR